jgi:hypothetical protein
MSHYRASGALEALQGSWESVRKLRHLVGCGQLGLSKQETMAHSKEALWRLGQAIKEMSSNTVVEPQMWCVLQALTGHKMSPQQLEQLYKTMKQQGYRCPAVPPGSLQHPAAVTDGESDSGTTLCQILRVSLVQLHVIVTLTTIVNC